MSVPEFVPRPAEGLKYPNAVRMLFSRVERSPHGPALRHKLGGAWQTLTWRQVGDAVREVAAGLRRLGLSTGDRVAILAPTRLEWVLVDFACAVAGLVSVPIYPSLAAEHVGFILRDAGARALLVDDASRLRRLAQTQALPEAVAHAIVLDGAVPARGEIEAAPALECRAWASVRRAGADALAEPEGTAAAELDEVRGSLTLSDAWTWVYTSGTTGHPKGVELTHENIVYESWAIKNVVPVDETDEHLLVLPLAHIFARHLVWGAVEQGAVTAVADGEQDLVTHLIEIAPTFMGGVPRMYERLYSRIQREIVGRSPVTRKAFELALDLGRRVSGYRQRGQIPPASLMVRHAVADRLFLGRVAALFGGRLRFCVCGGAPLARELGEFFHACGVLILEGYGLTETTGATNVNRPDRFRFGTVGPAMPGCEIRIAEDGEVLVRGHNVMARYHGLPEETAAAFDRHGWFRTGDIGELQDGFLRITDRKKDLFKTTAGKYVAPRAIEDRLRVMEGIGHVAIYGEGRPYPVALIEVDEEAMMRRSEYEGLGCRTYHDLVVHPRIRQILQGHVDAVNAQLARHEQVRRFAIAPRPMTEQGGELTPTRKVRRRFVYERYRELIEGLYAEDELSAIRRGDRRVRSA